MAVLEAFVYDPLLNWRLIETGPKGKKSKGGQTVTGAAVTTSTAATGTNSNLSGQPTAGAAPLLAEAAGLDPLGEVPAVPEGPGATGPLGSEDTMAGGNDVESGKSTITASGGASSGHVSGQNNQQHEQQHPPEVLNKKALDIIHRYS